MNIRSLLLSFAALICTAFAQAAPAQLEPIVLRMSPVSQFCETLDRVCAQVAPFVPASDLFLAQWQEKGLPSLEGAADDIGTHIFVFLQNDGDSLGIVAQPYADEAAATAAQTPRTRRMGRWLLWTANDEKPDTSALTPAILESSAKKTASACEMEIPASLIPFFCADKFTCSEESAKKSRETAEANFERIVLSLNSSDDDISLEFAAYAKKGSDLCRIFEAPCGGEVPLADCLAANTINGIVAISPQMARESIHLLAQIGGFDESPFVSCLKDGKPVTVVFSNGLDDNFRTTITTPASTAEERIAQGAAMEQFRKKTVDDSFSASVQTVSATPLIQQWETSFVVETCDEDGAPVKQTQKETIFTLFLSDKAEIEAPTEKLAREIAKNVETMSAVEDSVGKKTGKTLPEGVFARIVIDTGALAQTVHARYSGEDVSAFGYALHGAQLPPVCAEMSMKAPKATARLSVPFKTINGLVQAYMRAAMSAR